MTQIPIVHYVYKGNAKQLTKQEVRSTYSVQADI